MYIQLVDVVLLVGNPIPIPKFVENGHVPWSNTQGV